jgi:hypothetical protein
MLGDFLFFEVPIFGWADKIFNLLSTSKTNLVISFCVQDFFK